MIQDSEYVVVDLQRDGDTGEYVFVLWSNEYGWTGDFDEADRFSAEEAHVYDLPIGNDPGWARIPV